MLRLAAAYVAILVMMVVLIVLAVRVARIEARTAAERATLAERAVANATADYRRCIASIAPLRRISEHLQGVNELADLLATNSRQIAAQTPAGDPEKQGRVAILRRVLEARAKIAQVKRLPVPTRVQCAERRRQALISA